MKLKEKFLDAYERLALKIDNFAQSKKRSEVVMIVLLVPIAIFFLTKEFVIDSAIKETNKARQEHTRIINELNEYQNNTEEADLDFLRIQIAKLKEDIASKELSREYLESRLSELEYLYFTRTEWAEHLDSVVKKAAKHKVLVEVLSNDTSVTNDGFTPVMEVGFVGRGSVDSVMKYLHSIEASEKISVIDSMKLKAANRGQLEFEAKTNLWGLK